MASVSVLEVILEAAQEPKTAKWWGLPPSVEEASMLSGRLFTPSM